MTSTFSSARDLAHRATHVADLDPFVDCGRRERGRGALELLARLRELLLPQRFLLARRVDGALEATGVVAGHFGEDAQQRDVIRRAQELGRALGGLDRELRTVGGDENMHDLSFTQTP